MPSEKRQIHRLLKCYQEYMTLLKGRFLTFNMTLSPLLVDCDNRAALQDFAKALDSIGTKKTIIAVLLNEALSTVVFS